MISAGKTTLDTVSGKCSGNSQCVADINILDGVICTPAGDANCEFREPKAKDFTSKKTPVAQQPIVKEAYARLKRLQDGTALATVYPAVEKTPGGSGPAKDKPASCNPGEVSVGGKCEKKKEKPEVDCPKGQELKYTESTNRWACGGNDSGGGSGPSGIQHSVVLRGGGGGAPGGDLSADKANTQNDEYFTSIGQTPKEGSTTNIDSLYSIALLYQLYAPFNGKDGIGFGAKAGLLFRHYITSNPNDPGQSYTAKPADMYDVGGLLVPGLVYHGDKWQLGAGLRLELLHTSVMGNGDNGEIKGGDSGLLDSDEVGAFTFGLGFDADFTYWITEHFGLGAWFSGAKKMNNIKLDPLNDGGRKPELGFPFVLEGGGQAMYTF